MYAIDSEILNATKNRILSQSESYVHNLLPYGNYFMRILTFDISADWPKSP